MLPVRRQTETPQDGRQGPQSRLSSCQVQAVHPQAGDGGPSLLVWMCVGGALPLSRGGPIPLPITGLSVLPPRCCPVLGAQGAGRQGPLPACRDPARAANHQSSGSLQERRRNNREGGVRWEPGGAGQALTLTLTLTWPLPSLLTQDVEFAQRAGLLEHQPGVHAVSMELMLTGQHPEPLQGWGAWAQATGKASGVGGPAPCPHLSWELEPLWPTAPPPPNLFCFPELWWGRKQTGGVASQVCREQGRRHSPG